SLRVCLETLAYPKPGKSTKINESIRKKHRPWVRPGVELVRAIFCSTRVLMREDFPALERPTKATSGKEGFGREAAAEASAINSAFMQVETLSSSVGT